MDGPRQDAAAQAPQAGTGDGFVHATLAELMTPDPAAIGPEASVAEAAARMRHRRISCLMVTQGKRFVGILTARDLTNRVLAEGRDGAASVAEIMTPDPRSLGPDDLGADALMLMTEGRLSHVPVVRAGRLIGVVTMTDLIRAQGASPLHLAAEVARAEGPEDLARATARIPEMLAGLVAAGARPQAVTRLVTDVADAATRRLLALAEARLGPPPVPYLWLACGSQGRREQTGVSDQDNCLILSDDLRERDADYFEALATFVCDGLNAAGYVYCPGDMMATNPQWRQPVSRWRRYFQGWIAKPDPKAQMLASVMFDLRPIGGETALFEGLQAETLAAAARNSIFVAHMASNALKHHPPLNWLGGLSLQKGEHRDTLDLKLSGVVPIVDLARIYAIIARSEAVGTRERIAAGAEAGAVSRKGALELRDAWDVISAARLRHQAAQVRAGGAPDNFMAPGALSELERGHLRDAFGVVRTMQAALGQSRGTLT